MDTVCGRKGNDSERGEAFGKARLTPSPTRHSETVSERGGSRWRRQRRLSGGQTPASPQLGWALLPTPRHSAAMSLPHASSRVTGVR